MSLLLVRSRVARPPHGQFPSPSRITAQTTSATMAPRPTTDATIKVDPFVGLQRGMITIYNMRRAGGVRLVTTTTQTRICIMQPRTDAESTSGLIPGCSRERRETPRGRGGGVCAARRFPCGGSCDAFPCVVLRQVSSREDASRYDFGFFGMVAGRCDTDGIRMLCYASLWPCL